MHREIAPGYAPRSKTACCFVAHSAEGEQAEQHQNQLLHAEAEALAHTACRQWAAEGDEDPQAALWTCKLCFQGIKLRSTLIYKHYSRSVL